MSLNVTGKYAMTVLYVVSGAPSTEYYCTTRVVRKRKRQKKI
jgi:hypothetical protein